MLQNASVAAFTVSELLRENQQVEGGGVKLPPPPPPTTISGLTIDNKVVIYLDL